jgi:hypothetical protein
VRSIDEEFGALLAASRLEASAADQLRTAARALASMPPSHARSIACTRRIPEWEKAGLTALARRLATAYGLAVRVELGDSVCVRFSRSQRR